MATINAFQGFSQITAPSFEQEEQTTGQGFGQMLGNALNETGQLMQQSDQKGAELALGKTENLHDALITFEKAETSLKLLMQMRNKALEAYNEVLKMQF